MTKSVQSQLILGARIKPDELHILSKGLGSIDQSSYVWSPKFSEYCKEISRTEQGLFDDWYDGEPIDGDDLSFILIVPSWCGCDSAVWVLGIIVSSQSTDSNKCCVVDLSKIEPTKQYIFNIINKLGFGDRSIDIFLHSETY
jgi:hypothetical protein